MINPTPQSATMATILELSRLISSSLEPDEVFRRILSATYEISGADVVTIMLIDETGDQLKIVASLGLDPEEGARFRLRIGEGVAGWVVQHGEPLHLVMPSTDPRYKPATFVIPKCFFSVPLRARDRTFGALNLTRNRFAEQFDPTTVQMVEIFASHAAIAIENATTAAELRYAALSERIINITVQSPRQLGASLPTVTKILSELGPSLAAASCVLMVPQPAQPDSPWAFATAWPAATPPPDAGWQPDLTSTGPQIHASIEHPDGQAWLVVTSDRPDRYWRRAECDLIRLSADQIGQLLANERLIAEEQRSRALSRTLSQLAAACNAMISQNTVLDFILDQLANFITYDSSGVFLHHHGQYASLAAGHGFRFQKKEVVLYNGPGSLIWGLGQSRKAIYVPDVQEIAGWQNVPDSEIIRSWIGAPLIVNDQMIGVLTIDKWTPNAFSESDLQVAQLFADHVAVAIHNARLLREAQFLADQLQALHHLSLRLSAIREVRPLLQEVANLLHDTFGYYQVAIGIIEGDELVLMAASGLVNDVAEFAPFTRYSLQRGITGWVARHGEIQLVNNVADDQRFAPVVTLADTRSELVVPIKYADRIFGTIDIESNLVGAFNQRDLYVAEAMARQTAMALENLIRYEEIQRTQEHLLHTERLRALGELSSGVAHDFNNLLASILGHTQLLINDTQNPEMLDGLQIIERSALDGAAAVRRLQSYALASRSLPNEQVDLNVIVEEALAMTRPRWRDAFQSEGRALTVTRDLATLPTILGDGPALRDLVTNLILNALDAMPDGGDLILRTGMVTGVLPNDTQVFLEVRDTGVGIRPEVRDRIFAPFFSTKGSRGTGMGLAMVSSIVQRHHGSIHVQSAPSEGSTFTIHLPVGQPPSVPPPSAPALGKLDQQPLRILAVEDDDGVRAILGQILRRMGHHVDLAEHGDAALGLLRRHSYDLLCTDLGMPGMSGWEVIRAARQSDPQLMTLLITGWGEQITIEEAHARGADQILSKPFEAARLRQILAELQSHRQIAQGTS